MLQVVLDTNVLVTALRSRRGASFQLVSLIGEAKFRIHLSVALALKYEEVLKRSSVLPGIGGKEIDNFLNYIFHVSNLVPSVRLLRPNVPDPDDELVLELAVQSGANLITYNLKRLRGR